MAEIRLSIPALRRATWESPLGALELWAGDAGLLRVEFVDDGRPLAPGPGRLRLDAFDVIEVGVDQADTDPVLGATVRQLDAYFRCELRVFELPLDLRGTPFQRAMWRRLLGVPWGTTTTYRALAADLGRPAAVRAVGAANGDNPISIVVPCHRVVGTDGTLRGYGGGLWRKERLLALERA